MNHQRRQTQKNSIQTLSVTPWRFRTSVKSGYETQEELLFACLAFLALLIVTSADVLFKFG